MTQPQRQDDVHQDELCPPNKRYALMDANKKIDLHNPLCSNESKILANILQNHPLRFNIASSSLVPWIYLGVDVPTTQSQPIESTQGTHSTTSASKSPNPDVDEGESENMIVQDTIQLSIAEQKSHDDLEAKKNKEKVKEQLIAEEIKKMVRSKSYKESLKVEKTDVEQPVNVIKEEYESAEDDYELRKRVKGKNVKEHLKTRFLARKKFNVLAQHLQKVMEEALPNMVDDRVKELTKTQVPLYQERDNLQAEITSQINNAITNHIPSQVDLSVRNYMSGHILHVHPTQASQASAQEQQYQLFLTMKYNPQLQHDDLPIWLALKIKFEGLHTSNTPFRSSAIHLIDLANPHDDAHPEGENNAKSEPGLSTSGNQEQLDGFDFWTDTYAIDDDELPAKKVSQELVEEILQTVDEAKLCKVVNEMLRQ
nr:hypothetical protein [Tanacetum cinerariifolium]